MSYWNPIFIQWFLRLKIIRTHHHFPPSPDIRCKSCICNCLAAQATRGCLNQFKWNKISNSVSPQNQPGLSSEQPMSTCLWPSHSRIRSDWLGQFSLKWKIIALVRHSFERLHHTHLNKWLSCIWSIFQAWHSLSVESQKKVKCDFLSTGLWSLGEEKNTVPVIR